MSELDLSRPPAHDALSENAVIGEILFRPDALEEALEILRPEHFYLHANQKIFEACLWVRDGGGLVDTVTVASRLKDVGLGNEIKLQYLTALIADVPAIGNIKYKAKSIYNKWRVREAQKQCRQIEEEAYAPEGDLDEWLRNRIDPLASVAAASVSQTSEPVGGAAVRAIDGVEAAIRSGKRRGVSSGFDRLDSWTGGMHGGDVTVLAARPGAGKSSLAGNIALNVARSSGPVVVFSLEMTREEWATRLVASLAGVDYSKYRLAALNPDELRRSRKAAEFLTTLSLTVDEQVGLTISALRSRIKQLKDASLIVVDYLQLMRGKADKNSTREQEVASISRGLKELAKELRVPVLALCQLNRTVETRSSKIPLLSDLRESGAIEQDADNVMFLSQGNNDGDILLTIAKQRNGPTGMVELRFDKRYLQFSEV